jgi:hypothetical protein
MQVRTWNWFGGVFGDKFGDEFSKQLWIKYQQ